MEPVQRKVALGLLVAFSGLGGRRVLLTKDGCAGQGLRYNWALFGVPVEAMPLQSPNPDVTVLLKKLSEGEPQAAPQLISAIYGELRRLAGSYMRRERPDHTLQATALVHEAYLRLVQQQSVEWQNRAHFYGVAGQLMRRILVDHARGHYRGKRGGGQPRLSLEEALVMDERQAGALLEIDEALQRLAELDPRQGRVVELRFFGGLSVEETAEVLEVSPKTVKRDWKVARAWLYRYLNCKNADHATGLGKS